MELKIGQIGRSNHRKLSRLVKRCQKNLESLPVDQRRYLNQQQQKKHRQLKDWSQLLCGISP